MANQDSNSVVVTFKYKLLPSKRQHAALSKILTDQRILYNAALQERIEAYTKANVSIRLYDQIKSLTIIRQECEGWSDYPANLQRGTLKRLDSAFQAFFATRKAGKKAGWPRFKGEDRFNSFGFAEFSGISIKGKRVYFKGMPAGIRVHFHRPLPQGTPLDATFKRTSRGWHICLGVRVTAQPARQSSRWVGCDFGIINLLALSDGEIVPALRPTRLMAGELRKRSRALSRCKKNSNRRRKVKARFTRTHERIANLRRNYLHQVSARLVREYDVIAVEKLNFRGLAGGFLSKDVYDAGWATLKEMLRYKAEKAGAQLIEVNPRHTSQDCSGCGSRRAKTLKDRRHECPTCGLSLDRDVNAARNVLHRAGQRPGFAKSSVTAA